MDKNYLDKLNPQQRAAVEYLDGPELVIAGAGSGKTRVLTYKIVHLLAHGYEPWRILALTFTNKAAREMRQRISLLVGDKTASRLWMGTFHSIFARILRSNADRIGFKPSFTIYDASDSRSLVKMIIKDLDLDEKIYKPATVQNNISWAKNALISPAQYAADKELTEADKRASRPMMAHIYDIYCRRCFVAGAMDFDDLLYYTNLLLRDNPDILAHYREFFRYVLVDEYQDTNFAQHLIVRRLTEGNDAPGVAMVGDDAQSIYSFRGANIGNILNLRQTYPNLREFKLEQNYRSTQTIINAANTLIDKNQNGIKKNVFSTGDKGSRIELGAAFSDFEESFLVANRIVQRRVESGDPYNEFAILYRTNAQSRVLEESLRKRNIPYRIYGGLSFYQRKEVKDATSYFRLALNPDDDEALRRVINFPTRGIGDTTVRKLAAAAISRGTSLMQVIRQPFDLDVNKGTMRKLTDFAAMIDGFAAFAAEPRTDAYTAASKIISDTRLLSMLLSDKTPESISRQENLQELLNGARQFVEERLSQENPAVSLADFMADVSLATDQDEQEESEADGTEPDRVTLMTIHAAKGLEFSNVFIVGVEEDLLPSAMSKDTIAEVEEERRLLYVALTRAKRFCMMTYAASRFRNGQTATCKPSRFLKDIDTQYFKLLAGTRKPQHDYGNVRTSRPWHAPAGVTTVQRPASSAAPAPRPESRPASAPASASSVDSSQLSVGTRIAHPTFGVGTITEVDLNHPGGARVKADFANTGSRLLLLRFAKIQIL